MELPEARLQLLHAPQGLFEVLLSPEGQAPDKQALEPPDMPVEVLL